MGLPEPVEIGIRELRQHASRYVSMAQAGASIIVSNHGRPAARLLPITDPADDSIEQLIARGSLIPPEEPGSILDLPRVRAADSAPSNREVLDEIRQDRF